MKKILTLLIVATIGALLAFVLIPSNKAAPDFALPDLQGKTITNADLKDKVTLINFWFPSCPGCVSEMPKIIKTAQDYQGKNFPSPRHCPAHRPYRKRPSVRQRIRPAFHRHVRCRQNGRKSLWHTGLPDFRLIDKNGNILKTYVGEPNFTQLYQEIDQALAQ